jgi:hypothetical protein
VCCQLWEERPEVIKSALDKLHTVGAIVAPRGEGAFR